MKFGTRVCLKPSKARGEFELDRAKSRNNIAENSFALGHEICIRDSSLNETLKLCRNLQVELDLPSIVEEFDCLTLSLYVSNTFDVLVKQYFNLKLIYILQFTPLYDRSNRPDRKCCITRAFWRYFQF